MKKHSLVIPLLLLVGISCTPKLVDHTANHLNKTEWMSSRDSILFEHAYGSIYFSKKVPEQLLTWFQSDDSQDELFSSFYQEHIKVTIDSLQIHYINQTTPFTNILMTNLYNFNGGACLYSPSDWFVTANYKITDSTLLIMQSADPTFHVIESISKENEATYTFALNSLAYNYDKEELFTSIEREQLTIELINKEKGIYLWSWISDKGKTMFQSLKVDVRKVALFPIIIEDCGESKCVFNQQYNYFKILTKDFIDSLRS